jgi:hypothetical protein
MMIFFMLFFSWLGAAAFEQRDYCAAVFFSVFFLVLLVLQLLGAR